MASNYRVKERGGGGGKVMAGAPPPSPPIRCLKPLKSVTETAFKENISCKVAGKSAGKPFKSSFANQSEALKDPKVKIQGLGPKSGESVLRWSTSSLSKGIKTNPRPSSFPRMVSGIQNERICRVSDVCGNPNAAKTLAKETLICSDRMVKPLKTTPLQKVGKNPRMLHPTAKESGSNKLGKSLENPVSVSGNHKFMNLLEKGVPYSSDHSENAQQTLWIEEGGKNLKFIDQVAEEVVTSSDPSVKSMEIPALAEDNRNPNFVKLAAKETKIDQGNSVTTIINQLVAEVNGDPKFVTHSENANGNADICSKEEAFVGKELGVGNTCRNPSKLHEKLASLESRVKRIANDIKRTKVMLDTNNPESSKSILSEIQDKISGIEKAMGSALEEKCKLGLPDKELGKQIEGRFDKEFGEQLNCTRNPETLNGEAEAGEVHKQSMNVEKKSESGLLMDRTLGVLKYGFSGATKKTVNRFNSEELEERLFPHHKLLRKRPSLGNLNVKDGVQKHSLKPMLASSNIDSGHSDELVLPIDENPIALEFLASLNQESRRNLEVKTDAKSIIEMESAICSDPKDKERTDKAEISRKGLDQKNEVNLMCDENYEFDDQENRAGIFLQEDTDDSCVDMLQQIGSKPSTGGWFVSDGESVLLAHDDSSCSFYDIANSEEKAEYKPPYGASKNLWADCWLIRTTGSDGCSGRYVVAASAGNALDSGFCSWDFYTKEIQAFRVECEPHPSSSTRVFAPSNRGLYRRNTLSAVIAPENPSWWYKPCGPLLVSGASLQRTVTIYDIRDGDLVMRWDTPKPVMGMETSSPLQFRNKGKVVIAESEAISVWDINSLNPQPLQSVSFSGRRVSALHVHNTDGECGGGVRQRVSSSEAEGNDGVSCTQDSIQVFDFRVPSGIGLKIPKLGVNGQSIYAREDSIFLGCINSRLPSKSSPCSRVQQFSLRKGKLVCTYALPVPNAHFQHSSITQVWGSSCLVMGVSGQGLFVFDVFKDEGLQDAFTDRANNGNVREVIGSDDLYNPSFDYAASRVLLISRDRPALWRYLT
ncbi:hypothetical protein AMTRI_Chr07g24440 [Amborella trichopoda]